VTAAMGTVIVRPLPFRPSTRASTAA